MKKVFVFAWFMMMVYISALPAETNIGQGDAFQRGVELFIAAKYQPAANAFLSALTVDYENFDAYYYLGFCYLNLNKSDDAFFTFKRALELKKRRENLIPEVYASMMRIQIEKYNYLGAIKLGLFALKNNYKSANIFMELARAYLYSKEYAKANKALELALDIDPTNAFVYNILCLLFTETGNYNSAVTAAQTAIAFREDVHYFHANLGAVYERMQQYGDAIKSYQKALKYAPLDKEYIQALKRNQLLLQQQKKGPPFSVDGSTKPAAH